LNSTTAASALMPHSLTRA